MWMREPRTETALAAAITGIEKSLAGNPSCTGGLWIRNRVFGIGKGPSGGPEILALLHADDSFFKYGYGHVLRHPHRPKTYVSLLVWSDELPNAKTVPLLFQRFHYWMKVRQSYYPCAIQSPDDAYDESATLAGAAVNLERMIRRFEVDKRWGEEDGDYADSPPELRILDVYEFVASVDKDGCYPPLPSLTPLTLVGGSR
jgi:hypothetical protein